MSRKFLLFITLGALTAFAPMSIDLYLPSLPTLETAFGTTASLVQMTVGVFFLGYAGGQILWGPISDAFGRKRPLYVGMTAYILASIGCALATDIRVLIALRLVQALAACAGSVVSRASVRDVFQGREAIRVFSVLMLVMGVAPILAPMIGGYVLQWFGWRGNFWLLTAFGVLCLAGGIFVLEESHPPERRRPLALGSALREYWRILTTRQFARNAFTSGLSIGGLLAYIAASPAALISYHHVSAQTFGWIFGMNAFGLILSSQINHRLVRHFAPEQILAVVGIVQSAAGMLMLITSFIPATGILGFLIPLFVYVACIGFIMPNATGNALAPFTSSAGSASALIGTLQFGLGACTSALVGVFHESSTVPLCAVIAGCGLLSMAIQRFLAPRPDGRAALATGSH